MNRVFVVSAALALALACAEPETPPAEVPAPSPLPAAAPSAAPSAAPPPSACPAQAEGVTVNDERLLVAGRIEFDLYQGVLAPEALPRVDAVAHRLAACPELELEVQVHTDSMRMGVFNARQSQVIAEAIRARMVAEGAAASRIAACGYGESRPIAPNTTAEGRTTNMRVDFVRLTGASAHVCPPVQ
jgi:outer membrane protein OmpA-like peptidoglycan-associated protein